ncbi:interferon regulatory factor 4-like [Arapaima gigas]
MRCRHRPEGPSPRSAGAPSAGMQGGGSGAVRLRDWLVLQIESGLYPGLMWDDADKTLFRIPWKHAAKQDYRQTQDAALFKAWAVHKGKYREGKDKAEPSVWKTRLRCALNKSSDFQEVPERSQLDISEPYKVYRIQTAGVKGRSSARLSHLGRSDQGRDLNDASCGFLLPEGQERPPDICMLDTARRQSSKLHEQRGSHAEANGGWKERAGLHGLYLQPSSMDVQPPPQLDRGSQSMLAVPSPVPARSFLPCEFPTVFQITDFRLQVRLFYQGQLVLDFTSRTPGGCWILQGSVLPEDEHLFRSCAMEQVCFPPLEAFRMSGAVRAAMARLLAHLQRGVVVWVAPDGVFIKRFCQGRVYWDGPLAPHHNWPNKLEREKTTKLLDVSVFFQGMKHFLHGGTRANSQINLCFGEEYPEPVQSKDKKLITAQIEPLFIKNLLRSIQRHPDQMKPQLPGPRQDHRQPPPCPSPDPAVMLDTSVGPLS